MSRYKYYHIDLGMFTTEVKLCFDQKGFDDILKDHEIDLSVRAFETGIAESHYISDGYLGVAIMVINLEECDQDPHFLAGVIAHESLHIVCRVFEHIGEKISTVGEEVIAYTLEHVVKQVSKASEIEMERRRVGVENRSEIEQKSQRKRRNVPKMDIECVGSQRPHSIPEQENLAD